MENADQKHKSNKTPWYGSPIILISLIFTGLAALFAFLTWLDSTKVAHVSYDLSCTVLASIRDDVAGDEGPEIVLLVDGKQATSAYACKITYISDGDIDVPKDAMTNPINIRVPNGTMVNPVVATEEFDAADVNAWSSNEAGIRFPRFLFKKGRRVQATFIMLGDGSGKPTITLDGDFRDIDIDQVSDSAPDLDQKSLIRSIGAGIVTSFAFLLVGFASWTFAQQRRFSDDRNDLSMSMRRIEALVEWVTEIEPSLDDTARKKLNRVLRIGRDDPTEEDD